MIFFSPRILVLLLIQPVLVSTVIWSRSPTNVHVRTHMNCIMWDRWCYEIALYETDSLLHDRINFDGVQCVDRIDRTVSLIGRDQGDGILDNFYEFELWIAHNCSRGGKIHKIVKTFNLVPVQNDNFFYESTEFLFGKGEVVSKYFDPFSP